MKIGEFARKFDLRIDTIRYYIDNGMILPEKRHGQYKFDDKCIEDMKLIRELKQMRFKITEIKKILSFKRLTNLIDRTNLAYYAGFFSEKREDLVEEKKEIEEAINNIDKKLNEIDTMKKTLKTKIGIPLSFFNFLYCPKCQNTLKLYDATVDGNAIYNGELKCECGYSAVIEDGIIITETAEKEAEPIMEPNKISPEDYLEQTDTLFISFTQKSFQWVTKRMQVETMKDDWIVELGTGNGMVMTTLIKELDESNTFIATDINPDQLRRTKTLLEKNGIGQNSVFIACDYSQLPLKRNTIDCVLDIFGTTNHVFQNQEFLIDHIEPYMKKGGIWYGTYIYLKPRSSELNPEYRNVRKMLMLETIKDSLKDFEILEASTFGFTKSRGDLSNVLKKDSKIHQWACQAQKV